MGQEPSVRILDIQHIKGLEFKTVFFLGIELPAQLHPELSDKCMCAGAIRETVYLGHSFEGSYRHS